MHFKNLTKIIIKFIGISSILAVCSIFSYLLVGILIFPSEIYLMAGNDSKLSFNLPFSITAKSVVDAESITVLSSGDIKVKNNIIIDKDEEITVKGFENDSIDTADNEIVLSSEEPSKMELSLSLLGIPVKNISVDIMPKTEVVACGTTVGVKIYTDGIMVLGTGTVSGIDGNSYRPSENIVKSGDLILGINGKEIQTKKELIKEIEQSKENENLTFKIKRNGEIIEVSVKPVKDIENKVNKVGLWVRDSTQGIGTLTYYNPKTKTFGALGHGIMDVDTKKLMSVKEGYLMGSNIISIKKGKKGAPGELVGEINQNEELGVIKSNTTHGLYGIIDNTNSELPKDILTIGLQNEIHEGPANIYSNINGKETKQYDIYIESVNRYSSDDSKGLVIRITDQDLISKTNGIVQGMSGSPIIQDGKLIGAITHVFVQNPSKGYGIFIENMMKNESNINA